MGHLVRERGSIYDASNGNFDRSIELLGVYHEEGQDRSRGGREDTELTKRCALLLRGRLESGMPNAVLQRACQLRQRIVGHSGFATRDTQVICEASSSSRISFRGGRCLNAALCGMGRCGCDGEMLARLAPHVAA